MLITNFFIDFLFVFDILIAFRTTIINKWGDEVFTPQTIAKKYVTGGRFIIDILAILPLEYLGSNIALKLGALLKVVRITRLTSIIEKLSMRDDQKALIKIC